LLTAGARRRAARTSTPSRPGTPGAPTRAATSSRGARFGAEPLHVG
jgi:hypothetical protein